MTETDIRETLAHLDGLWPGKFNEAQLRAISDNIRPVQIDSAQAGAALNHLAASFKGYLTPAHVADRLPQVNNNTHDPRSAASVQRENHRTMEAEKDRRADYDDGGSLRWVESLSDADIERLNEYARERAPMLAQAAKSTVDRRKRTEVISEGRQVGVSRADLRKNRAFRGLYHAAWRCATSA